MGIKNVNKASKTQIAKARKAGALPGKGAPSGFVLVKPKARKAYYRKAPSHSGVRMGTHS